MFLWIAASVPDATVVNPNGIKSLLASAEHFLRKLAFHNAPKNLPKNPPDYHVLCNWVFDSFILAEELFAKALRDLETCVLVNNNLSGKLFSSLESPTTFDEIFKVTSVPFFIPDYNLLSYELNIFTFKVLYWKPKIKSECFYRFLWKV